LHALSPAKDARMRARGQPVALSPLKTGDNNAALFDCGAAFAMLLSAGGYGVPPGVEGSPNHAYAA